MKLQQKINNKLEEYLGVKLEDVFENSDEASVFGGAIRDIIVNGEIKDVDIMGMPNSIKSILSNLHKLGYKTLEGYASKAISKMYGGLTSLINDPITLTKVVNGEIRLVQLIRPKYGVQNFGDYTDFVENVDISVCGISYSPNKGLIENYPNAINHCYQKVFVVNPNAKMLNSNRISERKFKHENKGFTEIDYKNEKVIIRDLRIEDILN